MILWHLQIRGSSGQFKVSDLEATRHKWLQTLDLEYLQSKKALLGWCERAEVLLGTEELEPEVAWSHSEVKPITSHWKGANLQILAQSAAPIQIGGQLGVSSTDR